MNIKTFLKERRKHLDLSQRQVSELCGVSNAYLSQIESGERDIYSLRLLLKISIGYQIEYTRLINMVVAEILRDI